MKSKNEKRTNGSQEMGFPLLDTYRAYHSAKEFLSVKGIEQRYRDTERLAEAAGDHPAKMVRDLAKAEADHIRIFLSAMDQWVTPREGKWPAKAEFELFIDLVTGLKMHERQITLADRQFNRTKTRKRNAKGLRSPEQSLKKAA